MRLLVKASEETDVYVCSWVDLFAVQRAKVLIVAFESSCRLKVLQANLPSSICDLVVLELLFMPVEAGELTSLATIFEYFLAKCAHLTTVHNLIRFFSALGNLVRASCDGLRDTILLRRHVLRVERIGGAHVAVLQAHLCLVTVLYVGLLEVVERFLIDGHFIVAHTLLDFLRVDGQVYL